MVSEPWFKIWSQGPTYPPNPEFKKKKKNPLNKPHPVITIKHPETLKPFN
jgi:hypothetical protein